MYTPCHSSSEHPYGTYPHHSTDMSYCIPYIRRNEKDLYRKALLTDIVIIMKYLTFINSLNLTTDFLM